MADNLEQITLEADPRPVKAAVKEANADLTSYGENVVRVSDRSKNSIDRLVASMTKQAEVYGKTGVEKLIAQRDQLVNRYGSEQRAVDAVISSYDRMIKAETAIIDKKERETKALRELEEARKRDAAAAKAAASEAEAARRASESHVSPRFVVNAIKDTFEGRQTNALAEVINVIQQLKGGVAVAAISIGSFLGLALVIKKAAESLADYGHEMESFSLKTGIAADEVAQFEFAAKRSGQDVAVFERMMRGLTDAADDTSKAGEKSRKALTDLGVDLHDQATGNLRTTSEVIREVAEGLDKLPPGFKRNEVALALFKRSGLDAIPVIEHLTESLKRAEELHLGINEDDLKRWGRYKEVLAESEAKWAQLKRSLLEPLAMVWNVTMTIGGKAVSGRILDAFFPSLAPKPAANWLDGAPKSLPGDEIDIAEASKAAREGRAYIPRNPQREKDIADRSIADKAISSLYGNLNQEERLAEAQSNLSKLNKPKLGVTSLADTQEYQAALQLVETLKAGIKASHDAKTLLDKVVAYENRFNEKGLTPVEKLYEERKALGVSSNSAYGQRADFVTRNAVGRLLTEEEDKLDKANKYGMLQLNGEELTQRGAMRNLSTRDKLGSKEQAELEKDVSANAKNNIDATIVGLKAQREAIIAADHIAQERFQLRATHEGRMLELSAKHDGHGGELASLNQELAVKQRIRDEELAAMEAHSAIYDNAKERYKIDDLRQKNELENLKDRYSWEEKILEVRKKEFEEVEKSTEKLVNTLLTKPSNFGKELGDTLHTAILKPITHGISTTIAQAVTPLVYGSDGRSGINGALSGVFGNSKDAPVNRNTSAVDRSTAATRALTAAIYSGGTGTGGGSSSYGIPTGLFGGSSGGGSDSGGGDIFTGGSGGSGSGGGGGGGILGNLFGGGGSGSDSGGGGGFGGGGGESLGIPSNLGGGGGGGWSNILGGIFKKGSGSSSGGGGFGDILGNLGGLTRQGQGIPGVDGKAGIDTGGAGKISGVGGLAGAALVAGGLALAQRGLLGKDRGTIKGIFEGAAGGAAIGFKFGGPIGAAIGAAVGAGIGIGEKLAGVMSPENEAKKLVKERYGVTIDDQFAAQIVAVAKQKYGGKVSLAVLDPDIRNALGLYAAGTGQHMALAAGTPRAGSISEQNGRLFQDAGYQYGAAYSFQSNLPVSGGFSTGQYSSPTSLSLHVSGQSAADLLEGRIANTVTPGYVQDRYASSLQGSNGRLNNSAAITAPGLLIS